MAQTTFTWLRIEAEGAESIDIA